MSEKRVCARPGCNVSLAERRPQTRTCSPACRQAIYRRLRQVGRAMPAAPGAGEVVEPWERTSWLKPVEFAKWIDHEWPRAVQHERLNGSASSLERWRKGEVQRVALTAAEDALDQLGASIRQVPDDVWLLEGAAA